MALTQGSFQEYDFNRMVVLFTMKNDEANVACAISTDAMDQLEVRREHRRPARAAIPAPARPDRGARRGNSAMSNWKAIRRRDPARDRFPRAALK